MARFGSLRSPGRSALMISNEQGSEYAACDAGADKAVIRQALASDLPRIQAIYNHYVKNSCATFDLEPRTDSESLIWWQDHVRAGLPVLLAEAEATVVGWASLSYYHSRCAYRLTLEPSVYVAAEHVGRGLGALLFGSILARAAECACHSLVGLIESGNTASLKLVRRFDFREVGRLKEVGFKFGRWLDVTIVQKAV